MYGGSLGLFSTACARPKTEWDFSAFSLYLCSLSQSLDTLVSPRQTKDSMENNRSLSTQSKQVQRLVESFASDGVDWTPHQTTSLRYQDY